MYQIYQVMPNETLNDVANKIGITVKELMQINGVSENENIGGRYLIVPTSVDNLYDTYVVKNGDSIYAIAKKYGVDYQTMLGLNGLKEGEYIYPGEQLIVPKTNENVYVVKEGDTLDFVLRNTGKSVNEIISMNENILLLPDQVIKY